MPTICKGQDHFALPIGHAHLASRLGIRRDATSLYGSAVATSTRPSDGCRTRPGFSASRQRLLSGLPRAACRKATSHGLEGAILRGFLDGSSRLTGRPNAREGRSCQINEAAAELEDFGAQREGTGTQKYFCRNESAGV